MKVRVDRLREVLKLLDPAVPRKTALPVLQNVLLKGGKAIAGNLEIFVFIDLPEADTDCLIPHKLVSQMLKYVPGNEMLTIESNKQITFTWDGGKSSYPRVKPKDYPPEPKVTVKVEATMDGNVLMPALDSSCQYCSTEEDRPMLRGVSIFPGEQLDIAAGDGFRMAYQTIAEKFPIEKPIVIPSEAVSTLNFLWQHTKPEVALGESLVKLVMSKRQVEVALVEAQGATASILRVHFSGLKALIKLIEGTPPNFKQLIPTDIPTQVMFFPAELDRAVRRLSAITKAKSVGIIRLSWTNDTMTVSASDEEVGSVEGTLPVQADSPGKVALSKKYLLEYLEGKDAMATMGFTSLSSPVVFRHRSSPLVLVMPLNVQWE